MRRSIHTPRFAKFRVQLAVIAAAVLLSLGSCRSTQVRAPKACACAAGVSNEVLWIDTDIGQDVDDLLALIVAAKSCRQPIVGVSTTMLWPRSKAQLVRVVLDELGRSAVPVYVGHGLASDQEVAFATRYPQWPHQYGSALHKERRQRAAFEQQFGTRRLERAQVNPRAVEALLAASRRYPGRLVAVMLGPLTNLAAALSADAGLAGRLKLVVAMGGWYAHGDGSVRRPSYNTAMDLGAAGRVFTAEQLPLLLVNSQTLAEASMRMRSVEYRHLVDARPKASFARAVQGALIRWATDSGQSDGRLALSDPVTVAVACDRGRVAQSESVSLSVRALEGVHLKHPRAGELLRVEPSGAHGSRVRVVTGFDDASRLRTEVVETLRAVVESDH